jgi:hypothetical protein
MRRRDLPSRILGGSRGAGTPLRTPDKRERMFARSVILGLRRDRQVEHDLRIAPARRSRGDANALIPGRLCRVLARSPRSIDRVARERRRDHSEAALASGRLGTGCGRLAAPRAVNLSASVQWRARPHGNAGILGNPGIVIP